MNHSVPYEERRIPFQNMIYIADGPSDVPVFSILNQYGGKTYAVYGPENRSEFRQVKTLMDQGRIQGMGPADYREGTPTALWIETTVNEIAHRIVSDREAALGDRVGKPPVHILEQPSGGVPDTSVEPSPATPDEDTPTA